MSKFVSYDTLQVALSEIALTKFIDATPETPISACLIAMRQADTGALAVIQNQKLIGIVTESDLIKHYKNDHKFGEQKIETIMTKKPFTLSLTNTVWDCFELFTKGDFRHVPILAQDGTLSAMLSIKDILNMIVDNFSDTFSELGTLTKWQVLEEQQTDGSLLVPEKAEHAGISSDLFLTPIRRIASDRVCMIDRSGSIGDCINIIRKDRVPIVCVMEYQTKLVGLVSERDILKKFFGSTLSPESSIELIMTKNPHTLHPKHLLAYGINNMFKYKYRNLLIVDDDVYPCGVINFIDILRFVYHHIENQKA